MDWSIKSVVRNDDGSCSLKISGAAEHIDRAELMKWLREQLKEISMPPDSAFFVTGGYDPDAGEGAEPEYVVEATVIPPDRSEAEAKRLAETEAQRIFEVEQRLLELRRARCHFCGDAKGAELAKFLQDSGIMLRQLAQLGASQEKIDAAKSDVEAALYALQSRM